jgi:hypothetical protein
MLLSGSSATRTMPAPNGVAGQDFPELGRCVSLAPEEYVCEFLRTVTKTKLRPPAQEPGHRRITPLFGG